MTVAVSCNLSDGVILGVDSAVTVPAEAGVVKVYENAEKLFQLGKRPIGIATFGLGVFGSRTIGSYVREYEVTDPDDLLQADTWTVQAIVESLRSFFLGIYDEQFGPQVTAQLGKPIAEVPPEQLPQFGLVVGGFSSNAYLSEVWEISLPMHRQPGTAVQKRQPGQFGTNWFATFEPIRRYVLGFDPQLIDRLMTRIVELKGIELTPQDVMLLQQEVISQFEYQVPFPAMPMKEGLAHTRFLIELVINHHRFVAGAPVVGGEARLGMVTYRGDEFEFIDGY